MAIAVALGILTHGRCADAEPTAGGDAKTPQITRPQAIDATVKYPRGGSGDSSVVLELLIAADGSVESAAVVSGDPPFSGAAVDAAARFRFLPALRSGVPVRAKIHLTVEFEQPPAPEEPLTTTPAATTPAPSPSPESAASPVQAPVEITVAGTRPEGETRLSEVEIKQLPGAFGDPFRAIDVLPGVTPVVSGLPYFFLRGAPPGNIRYTLGGVPVPTLYHLALGPGVVHPVFISSVDVHAGAYPVAEGRALGGVVEGRLAEPSYGFRGGGNVRLLDSGAFVEAPIADGRGSVMVGGRYSYTGALLSALDANQAVDYWDYQSRVRYDFDNDRVELLLFGSGDLLKERPELQRELVTIIDMDFHRAELSWEKPWQGGHLRNSLLFGIDHSVLDEGMVAFDNRLVGARSQLAQRLSEWAELRVGGEVLFERLDQRVTKAASDIGEVNREFVIDENGNEVELPQEEHVPTPTSLHFDSRDDLSVAAHIDVPFEVADGVQLTPGVRADFYHFGRDQAWAVDPRVAARFEVHERITLTHDLGIVHQTPSFLIPIPGAKPSLRGGLQRAVKHSAGAELKLPASFSTSVELFHNLFFNMTDILGVERLAEEDEQDPDAIRAKGRAYGAEVAVRRSFSERVGVLASYTLSRSERGVDSLQSPAATDRTHVANLAGSFQLGAGWRLGSRGLFTTGTPARLPEGEISRNPPRAPAFWRLDLRVGKRWRLGDAGYWALTLEVQNVTLNREVTLRDCSEGPCKDEFTDPITIPNLGVEARF